MRFAASGFLGTMFSSRSVDFFADGHADRLGPLRGAFLYFRQEPGQEPCERQEGA